LWRLPKGSYLPVRTWASGKKKLVPSFPIIKKEEGKNRSVGVGDLRGRGHDLSEEFVDLWPPNPPPHPPPPKKHPTPNPRPPTQPNRQHNNHQNYFRGRGQVEYLFPIFK